MQLDLTDEESEALVRELNAIIDNDRYPLSPRITGTGQRREFLLPKRGCFGRLGLAWATLATGEVLERRMEM
jgi:hypothetical protein